MIKRRRYLKLIQSFEKNQKMMRLFTGSFAFWLMYLMRKFMSFDYSVEPNWTCNCQLPFYLLFGVKSHSNTFLSDSSWEWNCGKIINKRKYKYIHGTLCTWNWHPTHLCCSLSLCCHKFYHGGQLKTPILLWN